MNWRPPGREGNPCGVQTSSSLCVASSGPSLQDHIKTCRSLQHSYVLLNQWSSFFDRINCRYMWNIIYRGFRMFLSSILVFQKTGEQTLYRGYTDSKRITNYSILAWFEVLTEVLLKIQAFWVVTLYRLVESYRRFGAWCIYVQGQEVEGGGTLLLRNVKYLPVDRM